MGGGRGSGLAVAVSKPIAQSFPDPPNQNDELDYNDAIEAQAGPGCKAELCNDELVVLWC
jgi:hypothetical protein